MTDQTTPLRDRITRWEQAAWAAGRTVDRNALAVYMAIADQEQAAVLREAIDVAREEGHRLEVEAGIEAARGARCVAYLLRKLLANEQPLRRVADETATTETQAAAPAETDEERADREETERDHARGDHTHCGLTCEVQMPTEHLRNFVIAKGYPGTKGALAELERRAAAGARQDGARP
ncbi:hypothetical protein ACFW5U_27845 [Streptomyces rochei]|uniref:hypothetical protein n=1 Tax=Streptomyces rochei TaxID=1928 RepID=UPI0036A6426C